MLAIMASHLARSDASDRLVLVRFEMGSRTYEQYREMGFRRYMNYTVIGSDQLDNNDLIAVYRDVDGTEFRIP